MLNDNYRVTIDDIENALHRQRVRKPIGPGDVPILHTGWTHLVTDDPGRYLSMEPGIYRVPVAGGEPRLLSEGGFAPHFGAGEDRVFFSERQDRTLVLKSVDLRGHDERAHLKGKNLTEFSLSPDGRWIAFTEGFNAYVAPFALTGKTVDVSSSSSAQLVRCRVR